ncbi:hypothetical protein [Klebsiella pneumoniae]|uniref:hypothetical protein n=1 Tax=Klebsiella pneumoniae TaxID=573 RepID=UPI0012F11727|nr:hypothetical protein [Salmonella enterica subsp. enterica serovar Ajiobo]
MLISGIVLLYSALFVFVFICKTVKFRVIRMSRITGMLFLFVVLLISGAAFINQAFYQRDGLSLWAKMTGQGHVQTEPCLPEMGVNLSTGELIWMQPNFGCDGFFPDIRDINFTVTAGMFLLLISFSMFILMATNLRYIRKKPYKGFIFVAVVMLISGTAMIYHAFYQYM